MVYRRNQVPALNLEDSEFDEKRLQWQKVKDFFQTFVGEDGSLIGGVNAYPTPDEFRRQFEQHLRDRLTAVLEGLHGPGETTAPSQEPEVEDRVLWTDAPYPGLETFKPEQAPIFFGRGPEIDQLLEVLRDPAIRFVAIVGASGSGKSSLVAAGLIPRLRAGALPGSSQWVDVTFKPGERGGDPFLALAYALKAELSTTGRREDDLADELRIKPSGFAAYADQLLSGSSPAAEFLLIVDQFEEIFTPVADDARADFIGFIETVVGMPQMRVIATIRADFTADVADMPVLANLFQGRGIFMLSAPGVLALTEMIRCPAQMAGYEIRDDLCDRILKDTGTDAGALALMAFALHEVYEHGKGSGKFTLQDYESLKGVAGAIQLQAERALKRLEPTDERALHALFSDLMEVNDQGVATRRRAALEQIHKDPSKKRLADALVEARILVTDGELAENPTTEVAHEAVFTGWRRLASWIESNAGKLRVCRSLAMAARDWQQAGSPSFKHLPDRATLKQYRGVRPACSLGADAAVVRSFLGAARWRQRFWSGFLAMVVLVVGILGVDIWLRSQEMNWNVLRIWSMAQFGLYGGPDMVSIPGGAFQMGSSDCTSDSKSVECPQHPVTIQSFEIGKYELTFDEYAAFVWGRDDVDLPHDEGWDRGLRPVINVSWNDAQAYIEWLNKKVKGKGFRLPTEAEWEYAARAGTETRFFFGDDADKFGEYAWYYNNSEGRTHPVGTKQPNAWDLYDMHGNVDELLEDGWHNNYEGAPDDGRAWVDDPRRYSRVIRGGAWNDYAQDWHSADRSLVWPVSRNDFVGFRLSRSVTLGP